MYSLKRCTEALHVWFEQDLGNYRMHFRGSFYGRLQALLDRGKVLTEQVNFAPTMDELICSEVFKDIG